MGTCLRQSPGTWLLGKLDKNLGEGIEGKYWCRILSFCCESISSWQEGTRNRIVESTWGLVALHEVKKTVDAKITRTLRHELHSLVLYDYDDDDDWSSDVNDDVNDAKMDVLWSKYWNRSEPAMGLGGREAQLQGERGFSARRNWSSCIAASPWSKSAKNHVMMISMMRRM